MPAVSSRGRGRRTINEINMVPFIDVMLVLLIIFMVTAPMITPSVIDLPSVGKAAKQPDQVIQIVVQKDGSLEMVNDAKTSKINFDNLANTVQLSQQVKQVLRLSSVPIGMSNMKWWSRSWTPCSAQAFNG